MTDAAVSAGPAIDPTALALLSIFGGAALAGVFAFVGAWLQGRREHDKWLRERRFETYAAFITTTHVLRDLLDRAQVVEEEHRRLRVVLEGFRAQAEVDRDPAAWQAFQERFQAHLARRAELRDGEQEFAPRMLDAAAPVSLVGSVAVQEATAAASKALNSGAAAFRKSLYVLADAMRADLGVPKVVLATSQ